MEIEEVKSKPSKEIIMSIRTTKEISNWMRNKDVRPSLVFDKAIKELMAKE